MIYLDNAATTFPKPEAVYREAELCARRWCGNPGRSSHKLSVASARAIYSCREEIAELFGGKPENVVFTLNATYALNLAINALYRPGGEILISGIEHNAVLRPVAALKDCRYSIFDAVGGDDAVMKSLTDHLTAKTSLVVCNHVSNICGITLPVEKIGALCERRGIRFIIDASQSAGIKKLDINRCRADVICAPGHKGLYGLQGSGFALFSGKCGDVAANLPEFIFGGNGVNSLESVMPDFLPERFEAGTLPTPAIAGLKEGIAEVKKIGVGVIDEYESELAGKLRDMLMNTPGVTVYARECTGGTVLFNLNDVPSERVSEMLDREGICVRSGFHCCPLAHKQLETGKNGAVRASFSIFNRMKEVSAFVSALGKIKADK